MKNCNYLMTILAILFSMLDLPGQDYGFFAEDDIIVDGDAAYLRFYTFGTERGHIRHDHPDLIINNLESGGNILFQVDGGVSNDLIIRSGGHVGINTIGPSCALHVIHGNSGNSEGLILENENNGNFWRMYVSSSNNNLRFYNNTSPTTVVGSFATDGTYTASDFRLKNEIGRLPYGLKDVMQLDPKSYSYKSNGGKISIGFIAQEVQEIVPELVLYDSEDDLYQLNYGGFGVLAIKAIQDQQEIIANQKDEIQDLKARMESLEHKMEALLKK